LARKASHPAADVRFVDPNIAESKKRPVTAMFPSPSVSTPRPSSAPVPPALTAQSAFPAGSYFATKMSSIPALVICCDPNVDTSRANPVTTTFPSSSTATAIPASLRVPPAR
jgi:hypothetical protein